MPSDDNFTVKIANLTNNALNPLTNGSNFEYGGFGSKPVGIPPNTQPAMEAFEVEGHFLDGPQGTVIYDIDSQIQALFQFNVNLDGAPSAYFFAGLQPQTSGEVTSGYYLQVTDFNMPITIDDTSFTATVTVYPDLGVNYQVTPINDSPNMEGFAYLWKLWVVNETGSLITLNQLAAPLDASLKFTMPSGQIIAYPLQPWVATTLLPQSSPQLLAAAQCGVLPSPGQVDLNLVCNLALGAVLTITYDWQTGSLAGASWGGSNISSYNFFPTQPTVSDESGYKLIQLTVTISRAS